MRLEGASVIVVGAGLAGLAAATALTQEGARVTVIDARSRVGGRVLTVRETFARSQHAEAGGDLIDEGQEAIIDLVKQHGLTLHRILRKGFAFVHGTGRSRAVMSSRAWDRIARLAAPLLRAYRRHHQRWDSAFARKLAGQSVAQWLDQADADEELRTYVTGLRGFFLADPEELSLLVLVDQLASEPPGRGAMYRIVGGNDRLPRAMAAKFRGALHLNTAVVAVRHDRTSARLTVRTPLGGHAQLKADYAVLAVPATTLRSISFQPNLPAQQGRAIARLRYGRVTKGLLQFDRRFWKTKGRPLAYGTDAPIGALWDANEEQAGSAGILTLMAGGQASEDCQKIVAQQGVEGLIRRLDWLGSSRADLLAGRLVTWEEDPWAGGGYAYFDPGFDPSWREHLARPSGRLFFAGEHTSLKWQGYMNGAVESGIRVSREIADRASQTRKAPRHHAGR